MPAESKYTRAEMLAKPVSRVQMFANRRAYDYEQGDAKLANRNLAREIFEEYKSGKLAIENGYFVIQKTGKGRPNPKYKVGDHIIFYRRAVWGGDDKKEANIVGVEYDDEFGYSYATDLKVNNQPTIVMEKRIIRKTNQKPQNTMPKKKNTAKASATMRKASKIYDEQKATYQKMLKTKVRQGKKVTTAAKEASSVYKQMFGATPTARWKRAIREAKHS